MKSPGIVARPARWRFAATAGGIALLTVACGSASSSTGSGAPSPPPPASPTVSAPGSPESSALCADAAALRAALEKLSHVQAKSGAKSEITADLTEVKAAATAFANDARGQWQAQTNALKTALTGLQTAVKNLAANPGSSTVSAVVSALGAVNTAAQQLLAQVNPGCPSASPGS